MIRATGRVFGNAHRISGWDLDPSVGSFEDGVWLTKNDAGKLVIAAAASKKAYMTISSRRASSTGLPNNMGAPIQATPARDTVSVSGKAIVLIGAFELETDQYDTAQTYTMNEPLAVGANGKLVPFVDLATHAGGIVAHVTKIPASATDTIGFVHE